MLSLAEIQSVTLRRIRRRTWLVVRGEGTYYAFSRIARVAGKNELEAWYDQLRPHARSSEPDNAPLAPLIDQAVGMMLLAILAVSGIACAALMAFTGMIPLAIFLSACILGAIYFILLGMRPQ
jgi:hypothetical protein